MEQKFKCPGCDCEFEVTDGKIDLASKFYGWLWKKGDYVYISFIQSLESGQGNLLRLFDDILKQGYGIKVPTPFARMQMICEKNNFVHTWEDDNGFGEACEVWILDKGSKLKGVDKANGSNNKRRTGRV